MSVVEQYARVHIVTGSQEGENAVPVVLRYDPEADPRVVRIGLPGPHEWKFSRDLLERGLRAPVRSGDVEIWPCGRVQAIMEFHSPKGTAVVQFDAKTLIRFLRRTYLAAEVTPVAH
ncbi:SsgA family sporulation/cell division regulator [Streptomyces sp. NPDC004082]|uniref:SsgA family sporulation/cell division regulator n=1 Tax=unclassified Streptomyces TaxID=2593676 RepID=UPI0033A99DE0